MECPICKNKTGFVFGTCIKCGYNNIDKKFTRIEVDVEVLEKYLDSYTVANLIERHKNRHKDLYKH